MKTLKEKILKLRSLNSAKRLHHCPIPVVAITGTVASGKSSVTSFLRNNQFPVICADELIKEIYTLDKTKDYIKDNFENCIINNQINFHELRKIIFNDPQKKKDLEKFLYPELPNVFNEKLKQLGNPNFIFYDIPLLFENNLESKFDFIICVFSKSEDILLRLIDRDKINEELAKQMVNNQLSLDIKCKKSDYVLDNTSTINHLNKSIKTLIDYICY